jgi:hypothetical protein
LWYPCLAFFYTPYIRDLGKDYPYLYYKDFFFKVQVFSLIFYDIYYLTNLDFIYATLVSFKKKEETKKRCRI